MKFNFKLEPVLKHRQLREDIAKKEYAEAENKVQQCLNVINRFYDQIEELRNLNAVKQSGGGQVSAYMDLNTDLIAGIKKKIETEKIRVRELMQIAEEKKEIMIEAQKEKKIIEKIKEKRFQEYKKYRKKLEQKQIDEMVSQRYARLINE